MTWAAARRPSPVSAAEPCELVLIDLMLPGIDGFEACRALRRRSTVPGDHGDRPVGHPRRGGGPGGRRRRLRDQALRGQGAGRPDPGPAAPVAATRTSDSAILSFGDVEVEPDAGVVRRAGVEVHCTRTEFRLLCELATHPGKVLSREQLLERVWGYDYFGDGRLVDVHVRRLRTKIEPDPASPRFILTVRGMGYKLAV